MTYSQRGQYNSMNGYISTSYNPGQQKTGFIVFEVPVGIEVSEGVLNFNPYLGNQESFDLTGF
jgi:hypothetical protein